MKKVKVLLVDDDIVFGNTVMLSLNQSGFNAHYQSSLASICGVINEYIPDIIILNIEFGEKNSLDEIPKMKVAAGDIPIIFVSAPIDSSIIAKIIDLGGVHLEKPFEIWRLHS